ncbi:cytochrome P450 6B5-like [Anticarsia gemmatalis]|uniref:cytochrome P450 6B5-like n=1 Tax=Anticarsia gemmatalis TaxID=129554 RepID=UPI003F7573B3
MLTLLLVVIALPLVILAAYIARRSQYWARKNVPHIKPVPILGNFADYILFRKSLTDVARDMCQKFPNVPYFGYYYGTEPALVVQDPELLKTVMTKDFYFFSSREISKYVHREMLTTNLFNTYGDEWKVLRQNLTPMFTSAKMKNMFHLIQKCSHVFERMLDQEVKITNKIEARSFMARFTMDCIGSCAFGVDTNTMEKVEGNVFRDIGNSMFELESSRAFKMVVRTIWPAVFYGLGLDALSRQFESFFKQLMTGIFEERKYKPTSRNDFVDLILNMKTNKSVTGDSLTNKKSPTDKKITLEISDDILVAQCFIFFAAGYETSATTLSFTMYELAKHPEIQERVLQEVDEYLRRNDNVLKYECITEMPYLDACIDEALRLYPVLAILTREVAEDYTLPDGLRLEKGLRVHLPLSHLHYNPDFFPEPEEYRPERFYGDNKRDIKPYTYMPFGDGPRVCIGMRFAKMQMMAGFITLFKKYRVELADGMERKLTIEPKNFITQAKGGINLKLVERDGWEQRLFAKAN